MKGKMMATQNYSNQRLVWPVVTVDASGVWKHPVSAASFEAAERKVSSGNQVIREENPFNTYRPRAA